MNSNYRFLYPVSLAIAVAFPVSSAHAQSVFGRLAEHIQNIIGSDSTSGRSLSGSDARQAEADRTDQTLNNYPVKADKRGIGGIYYPNFPLVARAMNMSGGFIIGKVLIEYNDDKAAATLYTRHAFETSDPGKLVPKGIWTTGATSRYIKGLRNTKFLVLSAPGALVSLHYKYMQQSFQPDLQGNEVPDKLLPEGLGILLELEPGVLYVGQAPYAGSKTRPYGHNLLRPGMIMPVLYKEGKAEAAAAWTAERIVAHHQKVFTAADRASEEADAQVDPNLSLLPPAEPAPAKNELEAAKTQWQRVITDQNVAGTQSQRRFSLVYVYPTSPWSDMQKKQYVNNSWVDTVVSRSRVYSATFQDQEGKYWNNRFYLVEKAPPGVYFGERWGGGGYEYALPASAVPKALSKEAAMKYQNAVKTK